MKNLCKQGFVIASLAMASASSAWADFVIDKSPSGETLILKNPNNGNFNFDGKVEDKNWGGAISVGANGPITFDGGEDDEKNKQYGITSDIVFKFDNQKSVGFSEFSFKGSLDSKADGVLEMIVTDNNDKQFDLKFSGLGKDKEFDRIGVIANTKGEYIKSIELKSFFKSEKEFELSTRYLSLKGSDDKEHSDDHEGEGNYGDNGDGKDGENGSGGSGGGGVGPNISPVPEPSTFALLSIAGIAVAVSQLRRRGKVQTSVEN